ncbi:MAG: hypothetical protein H7301_07860 [Cryobacterium sp.]|nr:hypothetical protein [Oligoflexia bacterium]
MKTFKIIPLLAVASLSSALFSANAAESSNATCLGYPASGSTFIFTDFIQPNDHRTNARPATDSAGNAMTCMATLQEILGAGGFFGQKVIVEMIVEKADVSATISEVRAFPNPNSLKTEFGTGLDSSGNPVLFVTLTR